MNITFDKQHIEEALAKINHVIGSTPYGKAPNTLYEPIRYIMSLGGKRMRPLLAVLSYQLFKDNLDEIINPAIGVEVFHNFTLMHDDIMDEAPLRRGKETVHQKWNPNIAILSGDVMLVKAYQLVLDVPEEIHKIVFDAFNECATGVCEGQQIDMDFEVRNNVTIDEYLQMIQLKTAVLLGFSMQLGAIVGGASLKTSSDLYEVGINMGLGFQLKDDILDVFGDQKKFGKQVGGDIISNKKTFLMISALDLAQGAQRDELNKWINLKEFDPREKVNAVKEIYGELKIRERSEEKMNEYFSLASKKLNSLPANYEAKENLENYIKFLIGREI